MKHFNKDEIIMIKNAKKAKYQNQTIAKFVQFLRNSKTPPDERSIRKAAKRKLKPTKTFIPISKKALQLVKLICKYQAETPFIPKKLTNKYLGKQTNISGQRVAQLLKPILNKKKIQNFKPRTVQDENFRATFARTILDKFILKLSDKKVLMFLDEKKFERVATTKDLEASTTKGLGHVYITKNKNNLKLDNFLTAEEMGSLNGPPTLCHPKTRVGIPGRQCTGVMVFYGQRSQHEDSFLQFDINEQNSIDNFLACVRSAVRKVHTIF